MRDDDDDLGAYSRGSGSGGSWDDEFQGSGGSWDDEGGGDPAGGTGEFAGHFEDEDQKVRDKLKAVGFGQLSPEERERMRRLGERGGEAKPYRDTRSEGQPDMILGENKGYGDTGGEMSPELMRGEGKGGPYRPEEWGHGPVQPGGGGDFSPRGEGKPYRDDLMEHQPRMRLGESKGYGDTGGEMSPGLMRGEGKGGPGPGPSAPKPPPIPEPFTKAQSRMLDQYNNALVGIDDQLHKGIVTPQEGEEMKQMVLRAQQPLMQKKQQAEEQAEQQANQKMMKQMAQQEAITGLHRKRRADAFENEVASIMDPRTGEHEFLTQDEKGNWSPIKFERAHNRRQAQMDFYAPLHQGLAMGEAGDGEQKEEPIDMPGRGGSPSTTFDAFLNGPSQTEGPPEKAVTEKPAQSQGGRPDLGPGEPEDKGDAARKQAEEQQGILGPSPGIDHGPAARAQAAQQQAIIGQAGKSEDSTYKGKTSSYDPTKGHWVDVYNGPNRTQTYFFPKPSEQVSNEPPPAGASQAQMQLWRARTTGTGIDMGTYGRALRDAQEQKQQGPPGAPRPGAMPGMLHPAEADQLKRQVLREVGPRPMPPPQGFQNRQQMIGFQRRLQQWNQGFQARMGQYTRSILAHRQEEAKITLQSKEHIRAEGARQEVIERKAEIQQQRDEAKQAVKDEQDRSLKYYGEARHNLTVKDKPPPSHDDIAKEADRIREWHESQTPAGRKRLAERKAAQEAEVYNQWKQGVGGSVVGGIAGAAAQPTGQQGPAQPPAQSPVPNPYRKAQEREQAKQPDIEKKKKEDAAKREYDPGQLPMSGW